MVTSLRRIAKTALKNMGYGLFLLASVAGLLEIIYRCQWVDFYAAEFYGLNPSSALTACDSCPTLMVFGDSFSAQPFSYVNVIRDSMPDMRVINAAVPGTGIVEAVAIARKRLRQFSPDVLLYQVYTGNDLWDIRKTANHPEISLVRNLYWRLSDRALFLRFLNYRLGQFKHRTGMSVESRELKTDQPFSPQLYSERERMILRAEPALVQHSVLAASLRSQDLDTWLSKMESLLHQLPARTRTIFITIVPHCAQVNDWYAGHLEQIGATPFPEEMQATDYPFLERLRSHFARDTRVHILSPLPAFQIADSTGHRLYYENDPHLNAKGHALLGQVTGAEIRKSLIPLKPLFDRH